MKSVQQFSISKGAKQSAKRENGRSCNQATPLRVIYSSIKKKKKKKKKKMQAAEERGLLRLCTPDIIIDLACIPRQVLI